MDGVQHADDGVEAEPLLVPVIGASEVRGQAVVRVLGQHDSHACGERRGRVTDSRRLDRLLRDNEGVTPCSEPL